MTTSETNKEFTIHEDDLLMIKEFVNNQLNNGIIDIRYDTVSKNIILENFNNACQTLNIKEIVAFLQGVFTDDDIDFVETDYFNYTIDIFLDGDLEMIKKIQTIKTIDKAYEIGDLKMIKYFHALDDICYDSIICFDYACERNYLETIKSCFEDSNTFIHVDNIAKHIDYFLNNNDAMKLWSLRPKFGEGFNLGNKTFREGMNSLTKEYSTLNIKDTISKL